MAWVSRVHNELAPQELETQAVTREQVDKSLVRCPDEKAATAMTKAIEQAKAENDSVGGIVTCVCRNIPAGLGEPCFDKLEAMFAHAMLSIPATKGFEIGSGFGGLSLKGSQHNDVFEKNPKGSGLTTKTNNSGGIQGGISNGLPIVFRVCFKPPATIGCSQETVDFDG